MAPGTPLMLAFDGLTLPGWMEDRLREWQPAGVTLFRHRNVESADQLRELTDAIRSVAGPSALVAIDQEGGQLLGLGEVGTPFAGNMALGAAGDEGLAHRVGEAMGRELRSVGINVDYAPVCDVATRADNPSLGIRAFGDDPARTGSLAAAFVGGLQAAGVAATAKHFPGKGEASVDPHHELPVLDLDLGRLDSVEFPPFRAVIDAGVKLVMVGHYALPAVTGSRTLPSSVSPDVVDGLLRRRLGFGGVVITDALDMGAAIDAGGRPDAAAALRAGVDLLLCAQRPDDQAAIHAAALATPFDPGRVSSLRRWVSSRPDPAADVLRCEPHLALATELAQRSVTLVRDEPALLPLQRSNRILAIMPRPEDLTPADTSSHVAPGLAEALRNHASQVTEVVVDHRPDTGSIDAVVERAASHDVVVVGTISVGAEQAALVQRLLDSGIPTVTVALRTPGDLAAYPAAGTHACTYGLLPPSLAALARGLFGADAFQGRLPCGIDGLYPAGHGTSASRT